jgi:hypothetical protein
MKRPILQKLRHGLQKGSLWVKIVVLTAAGLAPALIGQPIEAAQLTSRKVTISTSEISSTDVEHVFAYTIPNTTNTKAGIIYEFCTTPLGTCTLPSGMVVQTATADSQSGWPNNGTAFTAHSVANENDCSMSTNSYMMCFERNELTATGATGGAVTQTISGITAPDTYMTVYVRITLYSDDDFQTVDRFDEGTVAEAYVRQLTAAGRVQERLVFCVASIDDDDVLPADCSAFPSTTTIDLGVIDNLSIVTSPVEPTATNGANDDYGIAMVNTNASGGTAVTYFPEEATNVTGSDADQLRRFRVLPADCSATITSLTDQCFVSASSSGEVLSAGTERFGLQIPCIDNTQGTTDNFDTANGGTVTAAYSNTDNDWYTDLTNCEGHTGDAGTPDAGEKFAFLDTGTAQTLATTTSVVDDEIIKLRFGATASATTPTGTYVVVTTYIATPTF